MPSITAEFQDRQRIIFTARDRSMVNVRTMHEDGPVGFNSTELLLIALANCSLGTLMGHPLLAEKEVLRCEAMLHAEMQQNPVKVAHVFATFDLVVTDPGLLARAEELQDVACACPMCNTISAATPIRSEVRIRLGSIEPAAAPA